MKSCIYHGKVSHTRMQPQPHRFRYSLFMMYLDLDEVSVLLDRFIFWSAKKSSLAWFKRQDHMGNSEESLRSSVCKLIKQKTGIEHKGPIRLLTHCRYFGYCFNPVSFYYCWDKSDTELEFIVAEISNTPWKEMHCYVLDMRGKTPDFKSPDHIFSKDFHISPFMPMNQEYQWSLGQPGKQLIVKMENFQENEKIFNAFMQLERRPITHFNMFKVLFGYPPMTLKVITGIHWQALRLWLKRTPFYSHPKHLREEISS